MTRETVYLELLRELVHAESVKVVAHQRCVAIIVRRPDRVVATSIARSDLVDLTARLMEDGLMLPDALLNEALLEAQR